MISIPKQLKINYSYARVPTIRDFAMCDKRIRGLMGPFGSGKSSGCVWEIPRRTFKQRRGQDGIRKTRWAVVRNTYPQLKDTTIKTVLDWFPPSIFGQYKSADHEYIITGFPGCEIHLLFRALDKPEHISNLLSLELTGAWINEAREVDKAIIDALDGRINRYPSIRDGGCTHPCIIMDTNPPDDDSWWYKLFEIDRPDNAQLFKQPSGLSPQAENIMTWEEYAEWQKAIDSEIEVEDAPESPPGLVPDYYINLAKGKSKEFVEVYIEGRYGFVKEGRAVYESSWNDDLHVAKNSIMPIWGREIILGFDFGLTPAAVICQISPRGQFIVLDELTSEGMGVENFSLNILKPVLSTKYRDYKVVITGDPAGNIKSQSDEKTCYDILRAQGFKQVRPATSNDYTARLGAVEFLLSRLTDGKPTFQLDPSCKVLRKGFNGGYHYKKIQGSERFAEEPEKRNKFSHIHDALQYAAMHVTEAQRKSERRIIRPRNTYTPASIAGY